MRFKKGHIGFWKGKKLSEEHKSKVIKALNPGWNKGTKGICKPNSGSFKRGSIPWNKGLPKEQQPRYGISHKGVIPWNKNKLCPHLSGENSPSWKGGLSKINKTIRNLAWQTLEYKQWRREIFQRDNYTCQGCDQRGDDLQVDHIKPWKDYPELRFDMNNGQTLCKECHYIKTYEIKCPWWSD